MENCPYLIGAKGFAGFVLCVGTGNTRTRVLASENPVHVEKSGHRTPCTENSENSTKKLGGKNERITENQNQAKGL